MILIQASIIIASEICSHLSTSCCWSQESRQECWCREVHLLGVPGKYGCRWNSQLEMWDPLPGFSAFWICLHEEFLFKVPFSFFSQPDFFIFFALKNIWLKIKCYYMHTASSSKGCQTLKSNYFFFLSIVASWRRSLFTHFNDNTLPLRFPIWPQIKWRMVLKVGVHGCFWSQNVYIKILNGNSIANFQPKLALPWVAVLISYRYCCRDQGCIPKFCLSHIPNVATSSGTLLYISPFLRLVF